MDTRTPFELLALAGEAKDEAIAEILAKAAATVALHIRDKAVEDAEITLRTQQG